MSDKKNDIIENQNKLKVNYTSLVQKVNRRFYYNCADNN